MLAWASDRTSPCLPFCSHTTFGQSHRSNPGKDTEYTNLPLGETEVHLTAALCIETGGLLEGAAHRPGGNGQVAVVARAPVSIGEIWRSLTEHT